MSLDLYFGFKVGEKRYSYRPADDQAFAAFINLALYGQNEFPRVTVVDVKLYDELRKRQVETDDDATYDALSRVLHGSPVQRFAGPQCDVRNILRGMDLEDGATEDQDAIRRTLTLLGLSVEAAGMIDQLYWG